MTAAGRPRSMRFVGLVAGVMAGVGVIFGLSSLHGSDLSGPDIPHLDKVVHFFEYGMVGVLVAAATWAYPRGRRGRRHLAFAAWAAFAFAVVVGNLDEHYQSSVPGRYMSLADYLVDVAGATTAGLLFYWRTLRRRIHTPGLRSGSS